MSVTEHARDFLRRSLCAAYGDEFFLYEKMGRRAIDHVGSISETKIWSYPTHNPKKMGFQRDASLWQELEDSVLEVLALEQSSDDTIIPQSAWMRKAGRRVCRPHTPHRACA